MADPSHEKADEVRDIFKFKPAEQLPLTHRCKHYRARFEVPYFAQRYSIFSRYNEGIRLTDDAWFGVTPEPIASKTLELFGDNSVIIDAFAGAGGNTIAFARSKRWKRIIAVEQDAETLACAQHNASIYLEDPSPIIWVLGDSFAFLDAAIRENHKLHPDLRLNLCRAVIFASPPWGGPGYRTDEIFDLQRMQPYGLPTLHSAYDTMDHVLYLPRTSNIRQIADLAEDGQRIDLVQYCMEGASKGMVAYIPHDKARRELILK
ncbi:hypothetical protein CP532_2645 [Ophiocordyceps camponoti-leonardi (nom. inval.)]|nr:hypothetical protein CP532_2645 [Ophiocordyceps camponoti-leonardi (nom. inval.)]